MSATENKALMTAIFADLARGDTQSFGAALADDFTWIISGSNSWSGRYGPGIAAVRDQLLRPLFARFAGTYANHATRFTAEDDVVIVQCNGDVATADGARYDNDYCLVYRLREGRIAEVTEYMDSALAERVLGALPDVVARFKAAAA